MKIVLADYTNPRQADDIVYLLDCYAREPSGCGKGLNDSVKRDLVSKLSAFPGAFSILGYVDDQPAGLVNCFMGFSTFKCKPLVNIHDIVVARAYRGNGLSQALLQKVEQVAKEKECCKITLEVLDGNTVAKNAYRKFGFSAYELKPEMGKALFWEKVIEKV